MARNDTLVALDGDDIRSRREMLGLSREAVAGESGSPSVSVWRLAERSEPVSDRSAAKIKAVLARLEGQEVSAGEPSAVELQEIDRRLQALEAAVRDLVGATQELRHLEPLVSRLEALLRVDGAEPE